jgi:predicted Rossmann-fold nucleotide-binding protein
MGAATDGALEISGIVDCVILDKFITANMHEGGFRDVQVSKTMTERKSSLSDRADAFVCLPGGLGTLEEVSEVMSWLQLGLHTKPGKS